MQAMVGSEEWPATLQAAEGEDLMEDISMDFDMEKLLHPVEATSAV